MRNSSSNSSPLITIITVAFNAVNEIEKTMLSVLSQSYDNIEYIVIDGGSVDGTVNIIKRYEDRINYWISESDNGIYDAMNKGIKLAHGEWVNFMNCGDRFMNDDIVFSIFKNSAIAQNYSIIYGKTLVHFRWGRYIVTPPNINKMKYRMSLCHQSTFVRTALYKEKEFDLNCKIAADYNFFHTIYLEKPNSYIFYPIVIAEYDAVCGLSASNLNETNREVEKISGEKKIILNMKYKMIGYFPKVLIDIIYRVYMFLNPRYLRTSVF